jgi:type II secretory pathway component PulK
MKLRRNKKGMAMILVLTSVLILSLIIVELNYNTRISSAIALNYRDETAAYYLARSSLNVALLRVAIAGKAKTFEISGFKIPPEVISMVITLPFIFPPPLELLTMTGSAKDADLGMKDMVGKIKSDTNIASVGSFDHNISSMDSALNINAITLSENSISAFKEQMKNYYASKVQNDESFAHRWPIEKFERVLNNIIDWIDTDTMSRNGGDENVVYQKKTPPYRARSYFIPTMTELHMVDEMDDELFDFISPMISIFSSGAININRASADMWKAVDNRFTDDEVKALLEKIQVEGTFASEQDLRSWIGKNTKIPASEFNPLKIPMTFDDEDFKIEAAGHAGRVSKKIVCYISETYKSLLLTGKLPEKKGGSKTKTTTTNFKPEIVFWEIK